MKRFTETEKWRDPWFQKLPRESRTLWGWLCDRVDNAGVVDICWPICNAETGGLFSDETMKDFGDRVEKLENGKWWIPKFTIFQFGELSDSPNNKVHQSVIKLLNKYSLSDRVTHRLSHSTKDKDKDKDKDKRKDSEVNFKKPSLVEIKHEFFQLEVPESEAAIFMNHYESNGWLVGSNPMRSWKASCRTWKTRWQEKQKKGNSFSKPSQPIKFREAPTQ